MYVANSLFLGDYLTSEGQPGAADLEMIADAGLEVLRMDTDVEGGAGESDDDNAPTATPPTGQAAVTGPADTGAPATESKQNPVPIRTRGAGTTEPANA